MSNHISLKKTELELGDPSMVVEEVGEALYTHRYLLSLKTLTWATTLIVVVMAGLYALLGLPPGLDTYYAKLYFHSVGIGIAALAVYLVISIFSLQKHEPPVDFPMSYRAFGAVLFAAAGAIFYLSPTLDGAVTDIPLGLFVVAFILIGDVGGALFIQLWILPRKLGGTYNPKVKVSRYFLRMLPAGREYGAYSKMGAGYWLALASVGSAFIAGMIGFVNLWVRIFGLSFFSGWASSLGLDLGGVLDATLDPHSHEMALAIMAGVVALAAQRFHVLDLTGLRKNMARIGLWVSTIGVVAMTVVFLAVAAANYAPPTLLQSGPEGANGIAGDDAVMAIIALGAMILLIPLAVTRLNGKSSWKDSVRLAILGTWIAAVVVSVAEAFYVELHQDVLAGTANDAVFSEIQPMFGVFLLTTLALVLLAVDYYEVGGRERRVYGWLAGLGMAGATVGAALWAFVDPTTGGGAYWVHIAGVSIIGVSALAAVRVVYTARISRVPWPGSQE